MTIKKYAKKYLLLTVVVLIFVYAWFIFSKVFFIGIPYSASADLPNGWIIDNVNLSVLSVQPDTPAFMSGLQQGDVIKEVRTLAEFLENPSASEAQYFISSHSESVLTVTYERNGSLNEVDITPAYNELIGRTVIGVTLDDIGHAHAPLSRAVFDGGKRTAVTGYVVVKNFLRGDLFIATPPAIYTFLGVMEIGPAAIDMIKATYLVWLGVVLSLSYVLYKVFRLLVNRSKWRKGSK